MSRLLTLEGSIVLTPGVLGEEVTEAQRAALSELHLRKIDLADEVLIIDPDRYIGESTRREIDYAESLDKPVHYLSETTIAEGSADCRGASVTTAEGTVIKDADLEVADAQLSSLLSKCEAVVSGTPLSTSRQTLMTNRVAALRTALELVHQAKARGVYQ